eukprot:114667_1
MKKHKRKKNTHKNHNRNTKQKSTPKSYFHFISFVSPWKHIHIIVVDKETRCKQLAMQYADRLQHMFGVACGQMYKNKLKYTEMEKTQTFQKYKQFFVNFYGRNWNTKIKVEFQYICDINTHNNDQLKFKIDLDITVWTVWSEDQADRCRTEDTHVCD